MKKKIPNSNFQIMFENPNFKTLRIEQLELIEN